MYQRYLERIEKIADFLSHAPHPDQALDFLGANVSPLDEVAVTLRAVVDHDGVVRVENIQGFSKHQILTKISMHVSDHRPLTTGARTQKITWAYQPTVADEFPDFVSFDSETPWKSSLSLPIGLVHVYGLSFPSDLRSFEGINNYFESIRSLLSIYESALELKSAIGSRSFLEESEIQPLSERQEKILALLKSGKTNREIADAIGYSESLVRHETMIIYKKLRVEGRHELRENS